MIISTLLARKVVAMDFSLMFWGDLSSRDGGCDYSDLIEMAQFADRHGFAGIWTPERHFHPWGGLHPNPSVLAAALSMVTTRVRLRAGSVVLPLHHPIRVAEEWAMVDRLSKGRVEMSLASGWREDDFVLRSGEYAARKDDLWSGAELLEKLWRGEAYEGIGGAGAPVSVQTYPRPVQPDLPVWVTSSGSLRTVAEAGARGYGLLTHLLHQDLDGLSDVITQYQAHRRRHGWETPGRIAVMVHTAVGADDLNVKAAVKPAFLAYLANSAQLSLKGPGLDALEDLGDDGRTAILEAAFERYFENASLMGSVSSCRRMVRRLEQLGATELCCLVDFGLPAAQVLEGLPYLAEVASPVGEEAVGELVL